MSVGLVTFLNSPDSAERFWTRVGLNDGLRREEPEHALLNYIRTYSVHTVGPPKVSRAVANCWNAFYEGRPINHPRVPDPNAAIVIKGSPFDGKGG
jgi:hypothetical protein